MKLFRGRMEPPHRDRQAARSQRRFCAAESAFIRGHLRFNSLALAEKGLRQKKSN
jgi:hypothetical protein